MQRTCLPLMCLVLIGGCSQAQGESGGRAIIAQIEPANAEGGAPQNKFGFAEALEQGPGLFGGNATPARMQAARVAPGKSSGSEPGMGSPVAAPPQQIAYSYGFGFQIGSSKIAELQRAHTGLCEAMGPKCRVMRISQASSDGFDGYGEINLQVAATELGSFDEKLSAPARQLGGELVSSVRDGEDLSENIIDTEAQLKSRLLLREKLTGILQNNRGSVAELIAAEKAVADVNSEIDEARNKLENYRNRIRYSDVQIQYEPYFGQTQLGFGRPIMTALRSVGTTFGLSIGALIYLFAALLPVVLLILALRWVLHRFGLRIRFWRKDPGKLEANS